MSDKGKSIESRTPPASSAAVTKVMKSVRRSDTKAEMRLRRALHAQGLRYRVNRRPEAEVRSKADIIFPRQRVCVFVDGCFWHGCPEHFTLPKKNSAWWEEKITNNRRRDGRLTSELEERGWYVIRVWEHQTKSLGQLVEVVAQIQERVASFRL